MTLLLKILILVLMLMADTFQMFLRFAKAVRALATLLSTSDFESPSAVILLPFEVDKFCYFFYCGVPYHNSFQFVVYLHDLRLSLVDIQAYLSAVVCQISCLSLDYSKR